MKNKRYFIILLNWMIAFQIILLSSITFAAPDEEWNRTFGGQNFDYPIFLLQTGDGGFMLTGSSNSNPIDFPALSSGWAIKTNSKGNEEWNISFERPEDGSGITNILPTQDGGFIITGSTPYDTRLVNIRENPAGEEINVTSTLVVLMKTDVTGKEQWRKMFGTFGIYDISQLAQTNDGGFILAGRAMPFGYLGTGNAWIIKTDSKGNEQWNRTFEGNMYGASSIRQTSDGGYVVAGSPAVVIKINEQGKMEWNKTYKGKEFDYIRYIYQTSDNGYILAGTTSDPYYQNPVAWIIKTDKNGIEKWNKTFGVKNEGVGFASAMQTQDSGFILAGWKKLLCEGYFFSWENVTKNDYEELKQFLKDKFSIVMVKTDMIEKIDDNKTIKISSQEKSLYLKLNDEKTKLNMMINDGRTDEFLINTENSMLKICRPGSYEALILKTDANGNEQWNLTFGGNDSDGAMTVAPTSDGGYIVAGNTRSFGSGNDDAWLIKIAGGEIPSQTGSYTIEKPVEKSTPGFEIFVTIFSIIMIFSRRKKL